MSDELRLVLTVVDDDPDVRRALQRLLRSHGHEVHVFASAEAYLADQCGSDCAISDCAILDIQLPGMSGLELEERLRQTGNALPVVFISAHDDPATRDAIRRASRGSLRKPFDEAQLLDAIAVATTP